MTSRNTDTEKNNMFKVIVSQETSYDPIDRLVGKYPTRQQAETACIKRGKSRLETFYINGKHFNPNPDE